MKKNKSRGRAILGNSNQDAGANDECDPCEP